MQWEQECIRHGMERGVAQQLMRCLVKGMDELCHASWQVRNREVHGVGAASEHEEMMVREIEAMRGEMGRGGEVCRAGGVRRLVEMRRGLKKELKDWRMSGKSGGQPRIDEVLGGRTYLTRD